MRTNAPESNSSAVSFTHLNLRKEQKEDYMEVGESKAEIEIQDS